MSPAQQDTQLHLVTVREEKPIVRFVPVPVKSKRIAVVVLQRSLDSLTFVDMFRPLPLTGEDSERLREDIVVEETGVHREDTHHQHNVTTIECHVSQFVQLGPEELSLPEDHRSRSQGHEQTVTEITEHDGEQKGESNNRRQTRVDFLVLGNTVGVDDCLEGLGELVRLHEGRRSLVRSDLVDNGRNRETGAVIDILQSRLNQGERVGRTPSLRDQCLSRLVIGEFVQCVIDSLLLLDNDHPSSERASDLRELGIKGVLGVTQDIVDIVQTGVDLMDLVSPKLAVLIDVVQIRPKRLGNLSDLCNDFFTVSKDHENVLMNLFVGAWINNRLRNLGLVHVKVTTQGAPQDAFERSNAVSRDNTCYEADVHNRERLLNLSVTVLAAGTLLLDVSEQRRLIVVEGLTDLLRVAMCLNRCQHTRLHRSHNQTNKNNAPYRKIRQLLSTPNATR